LVVVVVVVEGSLGLAILAVFGIRNRFLFLVSWKDGLLLLVTFSLTGIKSKGS
jgi:hypothetical protein